LDDFLAAVRPVPDEGSSVTSAQTVDSYTQLFRRCMRYFDCPVQAVTDVLVILLKFYSSLDVLAGTPDNQHFLAPLVNIQPPSTPSALSDFYMLTEGGDDLCTRVVLNGLSNGHTSGTSSDGAKTPGHQRE